MTLRTRLLVGLVLLAAVGLTVAGAVTYRQQHNFLYTQLNQRLQATARSPDLQQTLRRSVQIGEPIRVQSLSGDHIVAMVRTPFGTGYASTEVDPPQLPTNPSRYFTISSPRYRGVVVQAPDGDVFVVALSLHEIDQNLHHLVFVEFFVILGVLLTLALLAWWVVNLGLRPLRNMEDTAAAIAKGDLSRRVDVVDEHTEAGRLGIALNEMLQQIERAFGERARSEARLRQFVADASHELRTPLTSIRGYAELFRRGASDRPEDLAKTMRRIEEEAGRMGVLVDDLLLLARLDTGRPLERQPVDLTRLARDAVDDARAVAPDRRFDFVADGPIVVTGDEVRLRQVLANLLQNARRYTPPDAAVHVGVIPAGHYATIEVADEGPGMTAEQAGRVFERFYRADPSRTRSSGGTGLGLAIVAAIAEAHGGDVSVETEPGQGATFRVRLPRSAPAPSASGNEEAAEPPAPAPAATSMPEPR